MYTGRLKEISGLEDLFAAILTLKDVDECFRFFDDLCTVAELKAMGQRYQVAGMIVQGSKYEEIERKTGASSATISRVKRFVEYGSGGYHLAYQRHQAQKAEQERAAHQGGEAAQDQPGSDSTP